MTLSCTWNLSYQLASQHRSYISGVKKVPNTVPILRSRKGEAARLSTNHHQFRLNVSQRQRRTESAQLYESLPLEPESQCIKLLELVPAEITCSNATDNTPGKTDHRSESLNKILRVVSLTASPRFTALSYVRGQLRMYTRSNLKSERTATLQ